MLVGPNNQLLPKIDFEGSPMYDVRIERYKLGYRSNSMKRNAKNSLYRVKNCRNLQVYSGKFLKKLKSAGVKDLTNIVSDVGHTKICGICSDAEVDFGDVIVDACSDI